MLKGFREFILRGNVVDLAVAVVIGAAFTAVINAFVRDLITPLIAAIGGEPDFSALTFEINNSQFNYGDFINAVVSFLIVAAVVYFFVLVPINKLMERRKSEEPADLPTRECPFCFSKIPQVATRCAFCTVEVPAVAPATRGTATGGPG
ncbi:MAG: large conductance mechanosensitive channel protein MscL [Dehalococcoidia bacterium]